MFLMSDWLLAAIVVAVAGVLFSPRLVLAAVLIATAITAGVMTVALG